MPSTKASYAPDGTARYWVDGKEVSKAEYDAAVPSKLASFKGTQSHRGKRSRFPYDSITLGCHPDQIKERQQHYAKLGITAHYNKRGFLRVENAADEARKAEAQNLFDMDTGPSKAFLEKREHARSSSH